MKPASATAYSREPAVGATHPITAETETGDLIASLCRTVDSGDALCRNYSYPCRAFQHAGPGEDDEEDNDDGGQSQPVDDDDEEDADDEESDETWQCQALPWC